MQSQIEDNYLISACLAGDETAFGKLYDKYVASIYRYIVWRVASPDTAHDLTAEVFLKAWQHLISSEKEIENFKAWLYRIAANLVIDHYRKKAHDYLSLDETAWENMVDRSFNLEDEISQREDAKVIYRAMELLSAEQKDLLFMKYGDDLSVKEIAQITGKSTGTIRVALHRAVKALKIILKGKQ